MISFEIEITVKYFYFSDVYFITEKKNSYIALKLQKYIVCVSILWQKRSSYNIVEYLLSYK